MDPNFLITAFFALFVVIDPIGLAPLFVALTVGMSPAKRRSIAIRASLVAIGILLVFSLFGEGILEFIGISMPAFRIAGGILLFITALDMLFERRQKRREDQAEEDEQHEDDPSVFPLAIPLIAGPGSIATIILLVGQTEGTAGYFAVMGVLLAVFAMTFVMFLGASTIERLLGKTGITVVTRLLGMLLAALSVQFVLDGLASFGLGG
ncbi:MarC family protein [Octadecabacter sp. 1_MG-2023]|uniref:MarC family protein n=1 Tax=unclassified Octadecabacter TaxID=196158 RepID=UPI001C087E01|nr:MULTISPECIES: MarC family protein [unclassified Octadecabacter]MBU2993589.1 MarC family protein [Octadecabacter sp. B2R22]MDO6735567.1 MarC family protein [Octadecabacter sp. 1_MG-2023]